MAARKSLSVLMPVYNAEPYLDESIQSILNQTYSDFEFLILDDASTDNSLQKIQSYAKKDSRIQIIVNKENVGESCSRNILLKTTQKPFIAWMDADDISLPHRLEAQIKFLRENRSIDAVSCQFSTFGDSYYGHKNFVSDYSLLDLEIKTNFLFGYDFLFGCSFIRMKKIKRHNLFFDEDSHLSTGADHKYILDCFFFMRFANLRKMLYYYRQHSSQNMRINESKIAISYINIVKNNLSNFNINIEEKLLKAIIKYDNAALDLKKFREIHKIFYQIISINNFYGYRGIDKNIFAKYIYQTIVQYWNKKIIKKKDFIEIRQVVQNSIKTFPVIKDNILSQLHHIVFRYWNENTIPQKQGLETIQRSAQNIINAFPETKDNILSQLHHVVFRYWNENTLLQKRGVETIQRSAQNIINAFPETKDNILSQLHHIVFRYWNENTIPQKQGLETIQRSAQNIINAFPETKDNILSQLHHVVFRYWNENTLLQKRGLETIQRSAQNIINAFPETKDNILSNLHHVVFRYWNENTLLQKRGVETIQRSAQNIINAFPETKDNILSNLHHVVFRYWNENTLLQKRGVETIQRSAQNIINAFPETKDNITHYLTKVIPSKKVTGL